MPPGFLHCPSFHHHLPQFVRHFPGEHRQWGRNDSRHPLSVVCETMSTFKTTPQTISEWFFWTHLENLLQGCTKQFPWGVEHGYYSSEHILSFSLATVSVESLKKRFSCNSKRWVFYAIKNSWAGNFYRAPFIKRYDVVISLLEHPTVEHMICWALNGRARYASKEGIMWLFYSFQPGNYRTYRTTDQSSCLESFSNSSPLLFWPSS